MTNILTASESNALSHNEAVIERGIKTFYEVGVALADIRDRKLYRASHRTFEEYCQGRWQMTGSRAYQMIDAANVVSTIVETEVQPPANEGQARELGRVPEPERAEVWAETVERTDGKPTAAAVRETYEQRQQTDDNLLDGNDWVQPAGPGFEAAVTAPPKPKRRPLPEAFTEAGRDLSRAAERLDRLTKDDRFAKNRDTTHHQLPELLGALDTTTRLIQAMRLDQAQTTEEARRWWATSLHNISDALTDVANSLNQEK
ncbi:hypothetical protein AB0E25_33230 [Streptomyces bobili]|uniref:hypothetical protein n=1 Tax=Streptomyces bobili TaxID=67280 RepID=UPI0033D144C9